MTSTRESVAAELTGSEYGWTPTREQQHAWKAAGLFVIEGASDDLVEFHGVTDDELGAYDGTTFRIWREGIVPSGEECEGGDDADSRYQAQREFVKSYENSVEIEALWCAPENEPNWTFKVSVPHSTFDVMEDGSVFCRGIVIDVLDLPGAVAKPAGYRRITEYLFDVLGEAYSTRGIEDHADGPYIEVEETRKNGQEDTHMSGLFNLRDGSWVGDREEISSFDDYGGPDLGPAIAQYLNDNPPPSI